MMALRLALALALTLAATAAPSGPLAAHRLRADGANSHAETGTVHTRFALAGEPLCPAARPFCITWQHPPRSTQLSPACGGMHTPPVLIRNGYVSLFEQPMPPQLSPGPRRTPSAAPRRPPST